MAIQTKEDKLLNLKRGALTFILSYIVITVLAFGLYLLIAALMGISLSANFNIREDRAYALAERLYPILNLGVWAIFARMYFRKIVHPTMKQAWALGGFWLGIAAPLDLIYFVLIPGPLQVSAHGFYVGQFPWIYFTYLVVLGAPALYLATKQWREKK